jgi:hypothetical protein
MSTRDWAETHQIVTKTLHCFDDLSSPNAAGLSASQILYHLVPALSQLIVLGRDQDAMKACEHREIAWHKEFGISSYDSQASIILHLSTCCQLVNDGRGGHEGWYEVGSEEETWDLIVKAEELGLAEVKEIAIPQGIYEMPKRSEDRGTIEFVGFLKAVRITTQQQQGK